MLAVVFRTSPAMTDAGNVRHWALAREERDVTTAKRLIGQEPK